MGILSAIFSDGGAPVGEPITLNKQPVDVVGLSNNIFAAVGVRVYNSNGQAIGSDTYAIPDTFGGLIKILTTENGQFGVSVEGNIRFFMTYKDEEEAVCRFFRSNDDGSGSTGKGTITGSDSGDY